MMMRRDKKKQISENIDGEAMAGGEVGGVGLLTSFFAAHLVFAAVVVAVVVVITRLVVVGAPVVRALVPRCTYKGAGERRR